MKQLLTRLRRVRVAAQRGLTLVELIVSMGLMSIFMLVLTDIVVAVGDVQTESEAASAVAQDGRFMVSRLSYDIQRATSISTPASLGSTTASLVMVIGGQTHTYALNSGNMRLTVGANNDNLNSSETTVSSFTAQRLGNSGGRETITINFTLTSDAVRDSGAEVKTFTTTVGRR